MSPVLIVCTLAAIFVSFEFGCINQRFYRSIKTYFIPSLPGPVEWSEETNNSAKTKPECFDTASKVEAKTWTIWMGA
ncbi:hypothetical protein AOLI_G00016800 [Acnodon oligacanthus]